MRKSNILLCKLFENRTFYCSKIKQKCMNFSEKLHHYCFDCIILVTNLYKYLLQKTGHFGQYPNYKVILDNSIGFLYL